VLADSFDIPGGSTVTEAQTLGDGETGQIAEDGKLSVTDGVLGNKTAAITLTGGSVVITNDGFIEQASKGRGVETIDDMEKNNQSITFINNGEVRSFNDGFQIGENLKDSTIRIENFGKISSEDGQGIDLDDIDSTTTKIEIINRGEISADNADAIRPGEGGIVTNYGLIYAGGEVGSEDSNDAVDLQGHSATVNNMAGATISGLRHGITTDVDVIVNNKGTIIGRNGSGVGSDGDGTVINYGRITGTWDGEAENGDGDGVDIDFKGYVENHGIIEGTGAAGEKDGFDNHSEGIAMGEGTIINYAGALISGAHTGILIDDGNEGSAYGAVDIDNAGTIEGLAGVALKIVGDYDDQLVNSGTINGSVDLGGGVNTFNNLAGGRINAGALLAPGAGNTLLNEGTIAPGGDGSVRTTALTGNLEQTASGNLAFDINAAANTADRIDVSETAKLNGSLTLSVAGVAISGGTVTVLTAADNVSHNLDLIASPALQAMLVYPDTKTVQVSYNLSFAPTGIGLNGNQNALGGYLNNAVATDPTSLAGVTGALLKITSNGAYTAALDQLSPEVYGDTAVSTIYGARAFGNALLSCHPRDGTYVGISEGECVWADVSGRDYSSSSGLGYDEQTWSFSGGMQVKVAKDVVLGFAAGYEQGSGDTSSTSIDTDRAYGGVTLKHTSGPWLLAAAVYGGKGWSDTSRSINFGGLATKAEGDQDIEHLSGRVRAAYQAGGNALYVKPMVDVEVTQLWIGSVQETGGPGALSIASSNETLFSAAPALEIGGQHALGGGLLVRPFARAGAIFYSNDDIAISSSFVGGPAGVPSFGTQADIDRVMGTVAAGLDLVWSDASTLKLHYDGMFGDDTEQHTFGAKASFKF